MKRNKLVVAVACVMLATVTTYAATASREIGTGKKAKVSGKIITRNGDLIIVQEKKDTVVVNLSNNTKVEREDGLFRLGRATMDTAAVLPGLQIKAEGTGNESGQLNAKKIWFNPNVFDVEVAQEQQILSTQQAATQAQNTADKGVQQAAAAQSTADNAQSTASQAGQSANAAAALATADAADIRVVNKRVSDLGDYKTVGEAGVYFATGKARLDAAAKADLDQLAAAALSTDNYVIEVAGYASSTGTKSLNQRLSDKRAAAVVDYLRNEKNIPMRRILAPAGYGATHFAAENTNNKGRALNQRVDVRVLVNTGLSEGS